MAFKRRSWDSQPQWGVEGNLDLSLSSLVLPGQSDFDLVSGERLSSVAATPTKGVGVFGPQLKFDASQEAIYGTATALQKGTGVAASMVWVGELFASPDAYASLGGITYDAANNNPYVFLEVKRNFASNNLFLSHSVGGSAANITNSGNYTSGFVVIVAAVTSGRQVMYSRSATVRERVSGTTTGSMSSTATSRLEIGESLNARNPQAACAMQAMSFRAWTDAELEAILDDPFGQVFAKRSIWIPVSAAGGAYTLTADAGAYTLAGQDATLLKTRIVTADAGSYAVGGQDASVLVGRKLAADAGAYSVAGQDATLTYVPVTPGAYTLTCDAGAYDLAGQAASILLARVMSADAGAYTLAGQDATLTYVSTTATVGRPASDTSNTGWTASTGSDLYAMLDETTPDAVDYIVATTTGAVCEIALNSTAYPGTSAQKLRYRASSSTGNSVIVRLLNTGGATVRSETQALTASDTLYEITLTSGEIAAITSGALSVQLESA